MHPYPQSACTLLIKNMYEGLGMSAVLDEEGDEDLEVRAQLSNDILLPISYYFLYSFHTTHT